MNVAHSWLRRSLFGALVLACTVVPARAQTPRYVVVTEATLRKYAVKLVLPDYPEASRQRHAKGVAVAQIDVDAQGSVKQAEVLESPDALTKEAVAAAVRQWQFKPATIGGKAVPISGKLTFYFVIERGKGRVKHPEQFTENESPG